MSAKFNNKKVAINALKDQRINFFTIKGLWLVNDHLLADVTFQASVND